jgi:ribonucleoside-triphosphate reductase
MTAASKRERQKCEVYSRVVGYLRPVNQWNNGKRQEFYDRKTFDQSLNADNSCSCSSCC